jgi:predicted ATPase
MAPLKRLTVRGFKSIRALEGFELRDLNVLIGANGAGKSNFISLFRLLTELVERRLQLFVQEQDGPDGLLFGTRKRTEQLEVELYFGRNGYRFSLRPAASRLIFSREETWFSGDLNPDVTHSMGSGHGEAQLPDAMEDSFGPYVLPAIQSWRVYHLHDTGREAPLRHAQPVRDNLRLKPDAANLAPFLRFLRERFPDHHQSIVSTVRLVAPFFDDFVYRKDPGERVELEWLEQGDPETPRSPRQLSDGSLRFIGLATILLQPAHLQPDTILIDEPELGLHPLALTILAGLLRQASDQRQIIVSTQSVELVNELAPEDVIVVGRKEGASWFERLDAERLEEWLQEYTLGELWKMNVLGGRPSR